MVITEATASCLCRLIVEPAPWKDPARSLNTHHCRAGPEFLIGVAHSKPMGFCQVADGMKIGGRPSAQVGAMFRLGAIASFKLLSNETIDPKPDGNENLAGVSAQV